MFCQALNIPDGIVLVKVFLLYQIRKCLLIKYKSAEKIISIYKCNQIMAVGVRNLAQWLGTLGILAKDPNSVSSTDMATHSYL